MKESERVLLELKHLARVGDIEDYHICLERAKALKLGKAVMEVEASLILHIDEVFAWLMKAIQGWKAGRWEIDRYISEAGRLGLVQLVQNIEVAIAAREMEIRGRLQVSLNEGLSTCFQQWLQEAKKMGMKEIAAQFYVSFEEKVKNLRAVLLETAKHGERQVYLALCRKAYRFGLAKDVRIACNVVRERVFHLLQNASRFGTSVSNQWGILENERRRLGIGIKTLKYFRAELQTRNNLSSIRRDDLDCSNDIEEPALTYKNDEYAVLQGEGLSNGSVMPIINDENCELPLYSVMQNWEQIEFTRTRWYQYVIMQDNINLPFKTLKSLKDIGKQGIPVDNGCEDLQIEDAYDEITPREDGKLAGRCIETYEGELGGIEGDVKQDIDPGMWVHMQIPQACFMKEVEMVTSIPFVLTSVLIERRNSCSKSELRWLTNINLNNEGLSSLGEGILLQWCPRVKIFSAAMNRLTTLEGAFHGCESSLVQISVKNNFLQDLSGMERLYRLEVLHLEGNSIAHLATKLYIVKNSRHSGSGTAMANQCPNVHEYLNPLPVNCWPKLKELRLGSNRLMKIPLLGALCPNLRILDLGSNYLVSLGDQNGSVLRGLKHLRVLDVGQNRLKGRTLWEALKNCPLLVSLVASRNRLTELPTHAGSVLLQELWLNGNAIRRLSSLAWMPNLRRLYLQDNSIDTLEPLWGCPGLEVLDLSFNSISETSQLCQLAALFHLRSLQLNDNPVSDEIDYIDKVLEAVPWLIELDNEPILEDCKSRVVKTIFLKVMRRVGTIYLLEKASKGEIPISDLKNPTEMQKIVISCEDHQRFPELRKFTIQPAGLTARSCKTSQYTKKDAIPIRKFMAGLADETTMWAALLEILLMGRTNAALRQILSNNIQLSSKIGLVLSSNFEAKARVFSLQEVCLSQRENLIFASKGQPFGREDYEAEEDDGDFETCFNNFNIGEEVGTKEESCQRDVLEKCFIEHLEFDKHNTNIDADLEDLDILIQHIDDSNINIQFDASIASENAKIVVAVCKIQSFWRCLKLRRQKEMQYGKALKIQSVWRGYAVRYKLKKAIMKSRYTDWEDLDYISLSEVDYGIQGSAFEMDFKDYLFGTEIENLHSTVVSGLPFDQRTEDVSLPGPEKNIWTMSSNLDIMEFLRGSEISELCSSVASPMPCDTVSTSSVASPMICDTVSTSSNDASGASSDGSKMMHGSQLEGVTRKTHMEEIAKDWGFKDKRTVRQFLKARERIKGGTKFTTGGSNGVPTKLKSTRHKVSNASICENDGCENKGKNQITTNELTKQRQFAITRALHKPTIVDFSHL